MFQNLWKWSHHSHDKVFLHVFNMWVTFSTCFQNTLKFSTYFQHVLTFSTWFFKMFSTHFFQDISRYFQHVLKFSTWFSTHIENFNTQ